MTMPVIRPGLAVLLATALPGLAHSADMAADSGKAIAYRTSKANTGIPSTVSGRVSVIDGRTLWFPHAGHMVRLASLDACELPQWSYDPRRYGETMIPKPVPCGPLAKAWLKRIAGSATVKCAVQFRDGDSQLVGRCTAGRRDLALEMLRVGWARIEPASPAPSEYQHWQRYAMSARHGMWATYVLDMDEWRAKAIDRTLARRPIADFNLLAERESEISPPFEDARKRPRRTDR
ncbi:thermonuclease family protein [Mesorhizobium sp. WSM2239]|uniref:Thermonuclease family protein n=2 Tax=unclassified Mesorhizobium TaxID=325217 RepID=A0AAU8DK63_9HYPH